ncbi:MAG: vitamin K epoxide reductase family protein [Acidimicrobiales bacterium]
MSKPPTSERGRASRTGVASPAAAASRAPRAARGRARRDDRRPRASGNISHARHGEVHERPGRQRTSWRSIVTTVVSVAGTGVASYLTLAHYSTGIPLACPDTGAINCEAVTTSAQSVVLGVPVAVLGLVFFLPMLALSLPWAWRTSRRLVARARLAMSVVGIGFVFYLVYAELFEIQKICLWCTSVHVLTFVLFVVVVTGWDDATAGWTYDGADDPAAA